MALVVSAPVLFTFPVEILYKEQAQRVTPLLHLFSEFQEIACYFPKAVVETVDHTLHTSPLNVHLYIYWVLLLFPDVFLFTGFTS